MNIMLNKTFHYKETEIIKQTSGESSKKIEEWSEICKEKEQ